MKRLPDWAREAREELSTLRDFLRLAVSRFQAAGLAFGHGSESAYDEAAYLLLHSLHLPLDTLEPFLDARLTASERDGLLAVLVERVEKRVPAAYITGEAWLGEFRFRVDRRVIVPRSYIAELIREHFAPWLADPDSVGSALDLCTGSGCLAILLALAFPQARIDAADLSADALAVAAENLADYGLDGQVELHRSDLFQALGGRRYDLIVSNPPYVDAASMARLPAEYRHEPDLALGSGADGLDATRGILAGAAAHLEPGGLLVVEIGHNREAVEAAFPQLPLTWPQVSAGVGSVFMIHREDLPGVAPGRQAAATRRRGKAPKP